MGGTDWRKHGRRKWGAKFHPHELHPVDKSRLPGSLTADGLRQPPGNPCVGIGRFVPCHGQRVGRGGSSDKFQSHFPPDSSGRFLQRGQSDGIVFRVE